MMQAACSKFELQASGRMTIDLSGCNLVIGLGETGFSVARYLSSRGATVRVIDSRAEPPRLAALQALHAGIEVACGSLSSTSLEGVARVFVSPGLRADLPLIAAARERGLPLLNDIELFAREVEAPVIAVTGSNGKSTVASLVSAILEGQGYRAPAGGNLGPPALDLLATAEADAFVLEISSFQMEIAESLRPAAAAVLNVTPDHLDRHGDTARYADLKEKLLRGADRAIVNWDDPIVREMGKRHPNPVPVSIATTLERGYSLVGSHGVEYLACDGNALITVGELGLHGSHNVFNALAALALADTKGGDRTAAYSVLRAFKGLPHRCQFVARRRGVSYINDSKATNVGATVAALQGFAGPLVLIAGGDSKGADLGEVGERARGKVKAAVLLGAAAEELEALLSPICTAVRTSSMSDAVLAAARLASPGDTVLLSPACSSLDMFQNYAVRGDEFAAAVRRLPE